MNYEDIILLVKAGYTRDQIAAMQIPKQAPPAQPAEPPKQAPPAQPAEPPKQDPPGQPAEPPKQDPPSGMEDLSKMLAAEFAKLNAAITVSNLANAQQPKQESVDDILASIINPPQKSAEYKIKEVK